MCNKFLTAEAVDKLIKKNWRISFAESCTGGKCCGALVDEPGASAVLDVSFITYANEAKIKYLGVSPNAIEEFGVVSEPVAAQMACGAAENAKSQVGIGITGVAGPSGGAAAKPVGMVCFGFYINGSVQTFTKQFGDIGRNCVREKSIRFVFEKLCELL